MGGSSPDRGICARIFQALRIIVEYARLGPIETAPRLVGDSMLYYLMVDQSGAAELTRPVVSGGTFLAAVERIYLSSGDDDPAVLSEDIGPVDNFDPQVVRK